MLDDGESIFILCGTELMSDLWGLGEFSKDGKDELVIVVLSDQDIYQRPDLALLACHPCCQQCLSTILVEDVEQWL